MVCSNVIECVETCSINTDCQVEPCCSFGYCTGNLAICTQGLKEDFDICDVETECKSGRCINNRCTSSIQPVKNDLSTLGVIIISFLVIFLIVFGCYLTTIRTSKDFGDHYRRQRNQAKRDSRYDSSENLV
jgi:hypothetical protein